MYNMIELSTCHLSSLCRVSCSCKTVAAPPDLPTSTAPLPAAHSSGVPASLAASTSAPALVRASTTAAFPTAAQQMTGVAVPPASVQSMHPCRLLVQTTYAT